MSDRDRADRLAHKGGEKRVHYPHRDSDNTLQADSEDENEGSGDSQKLGSSFSQQPKDHQSSKDPSRLIVGGKYAEDESTYSAYSNVEKVDFDLPLTIYEETEDKGEKFLLMHFVDGDPEDPFNWSRKRKAYIATLLCAMTLFIGLATTAYSSGIGSMCDEFGVSEELGQLGLFVFNMTCAVAPLILAPFCELVGRRLIYAGSFVGFSIMFIGLALGKTIATILICRTLLGLFGCVGTILVGGTFSDMYSSADRAIPISSFSWVAIFGTVAAPIYSGFIDMNLGWRWIEGVQGIGNIPLLILIVFTLKETRGEVTLGKRAKMVRNKTGDDRYLCSIDLDARNVKDLLHAASVKAVKMLCTELVVAAFGLWIAFAWFVTFLFLSVIPITFTEKRGWNEGVSGLPYISLSIGVTLAYIANFWNTKYYKKLMDDPDHLFVPEDRLYGAKYGGVWLPIGLFIYSFTQYGYLTWVGPVIALAPISFGIFFIFESVYSYTSDCYGDDSSSAIAGQGLMRNTLGAVAPLFASQFFHNVGSQYAGLILSIVATLLSFIPFIFARYGATLRFKSKMADCPEKNVRRSQPRLSLKRSNTIRGPRSFSGY